MVEEIFHIRTDMKQRRRKGLGTGATFRGSSDDPLPPARPYLLKFSEPLKIAPPAGDQAFNRI